MAEKTWIVNYGRTPMELNTAEYTKLKVLAMDDKNAQELREFSDRLLARQKKRNARNG